MSVGMVVMMNVCSAILGYAVGVMHARNLNHMDREYWLEQGRKAYEAELELKAEEAGLKKTPRETL